MERAHVVASTAAGASERTIVIGIAHVIGGEGAVAARGAKVLWPSVAPLPQRPRRRILEQTAAAAAAIAALAAAIAALASAVTAGVASCHMLASARGSKRLRGGRPWPTCPTASDRAAAGRAAAAASPHGPRARWPAGRSTGCKAVGAAGDAAGRA